MTRIFKTAPGEPDFHLFSNFPQSIYSEPYLRFKRTETIPSDFLEGHYYLTENGTVVARASLYQNPALIYNHKRAFTVGNYECADNQNHAKELLDYLAIQSKSLGAAYLIGPMNGSTWENYRFSKRHDHPPFFLEPYHHLYYNEQFQYSGFKEIAAYYTNIDKTLNHDAPDILAREKQLIQQGVSIRPIDLNHFEEEIGRIYEFNTFAFKTNFLYTPITKKAFIDKYAQTKNFIHPEFTLIAEDMEGNLIAYYFCVEDFLNNNEKTLIFKTLARHPDPKWKGLGQVMGNIVYRNAIAHGFKSALHSFIYRHGTSTALSDKFSGLNYSNYVLYGKEL